MSDIDTPVEQLPDDPEALLAALAALQNPPTGVSLWVYGLAVLAVVCVIGLLVLVYRSWKQRRLRRAQGAWQTTARHSLEALRERIVIAREDIGEPSHCARVLSDASVLARQVALVAESRSAVAPLSGTAWLEELDRLSGSTRFTAGPGSMLAKGPYQRSPQHDRTALLDLVDSLELLIKNVADRQFDEVRA